MVTPERVTDLGTFDRLGPECRAALREASFPWSLDDVMQLYLQCNVPFIPSAESFGDEVVADAIKAMDRKLAAEVERRETVDRRFADSVDGATPKEKRARAAQTRAKIIADKYK